MAFQNVGTMDLGMQVARGAGGSATGGNAAHMTMDPPGSLPDRHF